jgi:hypothetical protein
MSDRGDESNVDEITNGIFPKLKERIQYAETTRLLEELVADGAVEVKHGKTPDLDEYRISDFGRWLGKNGDLSTFVSADELTKRDLRKKYDNQK